MSKLDDAMALINKTYGKGSAIMGDEIIDVEKQSSGLIDLDIATGGGYGKGRIVEIYGPESAGKTMIAVYGAIAAQRDQPDKKVVIIDAEQAFDKEFAEMLGLDMSTVILNQPSNGEEGLEIANKLIATGEVSFCLIDSVAALVPKAEVEGEMSDMQMGLQARLMSKALRKLTPVVQETKAVCIFLNQLRDKLGVVYGNPEVTSGGNALKFFASQRIDVRRKNGPTVNDVMEYTDITCKIIKNKLSAPYKKAHMRNVFGVGIDNVYGVVQKTIEAGIIKKSGSWFSYGDTKLGQGMDNVIALVKDNPDLFEELKSKL
jgi:recombination protein RecA